MALAKPPRSCANYVLSRSPRWLRAPEARLGGKSLAIELGEQVLYVKRPGDHRELAFSVARPLVLGTVRGKLHAVAVRVAQVERLRDAVIRGPVYGVLGVQEPAEGQREVPTLRVEDGEGEKPGRVPRGRGYVRAVPRVQADVVVVAAGGEEHRLVAVPLGDLEPEDVPIEP